MYDMYPWQDSDEAARGRNDAIKAVQIALDRRDNGGDATGGKDATSGEVAASPPPAGSARQ